MDQAVREPSVKRVPCRRPLGLTKINQQINPPRHTAAHRDTPRLTATHRGSPRPTAAPPQSAARLQVRT